MKKRSYIILGYIIIIIGVLTSIGGVIYNINYNDKYKGYSKEVSAKVIDSIVKSETKKDITGMSSNYYVYTPVLEYQVNKKSYRQEGNVYDVTKPKINDKINIKVNDKNPKDIKLISKDYTITILLIGVVIVVCGITIIILNLKSPKKQKDKKPIEKKEKIKKEKTSETTEMLEVLEDEIEEDII